MADRSRQITMPTKEQLLAFLRENPANAGKREIARAFGLKGGAAKVELKRLLREMRDEGLIETHARKTLTARGELPPVAVVDIFDTDRQGDLLARPVSAELDDDHPTILILPPAGPKKRDEPPVGVGDRVLARLRPTEDADLAHVYEGQVIRRIGRGRQTVLGVYQKADRSARLVPVDKRARHEFTVLPQDAGDARNGDLVLGEVLPRAGRGRVPERQARIREVLGPRFGDPRTISLIAVHEHGIPVDFSDEALAQAEAAQPVDALGKRTDLRDVPLITIDPADARDHDDAVWAAPDDDPKNPGGHVVIVAIADVAGYVTPGSALDRDAQQRGNSTYFPDRVVPMLPEQLSADLCSLKPGVDRPCLAVRMVFDATGRKRRHGFMRGLMRSAGNLAYERVQAAIDGDPDDEAGTLLGPVIRPLFDAYACVSRARARRAPLDLDLPEHRIVLDEDGSIARIGMRERFDAHRLIEEFMILANVCAAETLERRKTALVYRVHEAPTREKLVALKDFLKTIGMDLALGQVIQPKTFNRILTQVAGTEHADMVNTVVLRSQSQAVYSPENLGHFGLNLAKYAHFTSPIRRYADLIVHRALIRAHAFGADGLAADEIDGLEVTAAHISMTERRSMAAERDSVDRYVAAYLQDKVGAEFTARITSVTRFGLFVRLVETGAEGLAPMGALPDDYYEHDEAAHALIGQNTGLTFTLGEPLTVRLVEAAPITGGLLFDVVDGGQMRPKSKRTGRRPVRLRRPGASRRPTPRRTGARSRR